MGLGGVIGRINFVKFFLFFFHLHTWVLFLPFSSLFLSPTTPSPPSFSFYPPSFLVFPLLSLSSTSPSSLFLPPSPPPPSFSFSSPSSLGLPPSPPPSLPVQSASDLQEQARSRFLQPANESPLVAQVGENVDCGCVWIDGEGLLVLVEYVVCGLAEGVCGDDVDWWMLVDSGWWWRTCGFRVDGYWSNAGEGYGWSVCGLWIVDAGG